MPVIAPASSHVVIDYNASALRLTPQSVTTVIDSPASAYFAVSSSRPVKFASVFVTDEVGSTSPVGFSLATPTSITFTLPTVTLATGMASLTVSATDLYGNSAQLIIPVGIYRPEPFTVSVSLGQPFHVEVTRRGTW